MGGPDGAPKNHDPGGPADFRCQERGLITTKRERTTAVKPSRSCLGTLLPLRRNDLPVKGNWNQNVVSGDAADRHPAPALMKSPVSGPVDVIHPVNRAGKNPLHFRKESHSLARTAGAGSFFGFHWLTMRTTVPDLRQE